MRECQLAIKHLRKVCGEPPPAMELGVQWQGHELGEDPMIVLKWDDAMRGKPGGARLPPERIRCADLWWRN